MRGVCMAVCVCVRSTVRSGWVYCWRWIATQYEGSPFHMCQHSLEWEWLSQLRVSEKSSRYETCLEERATTCATHLNPTTQYRVSGHTDNQVHTETTKRDRYVYRKREKRTYKFIVPVEPGTELVSIHPYFQVHDSEQDWVFRGMCCLHGSMVQIQRLIAPQTDPFSSALMIYHKNVEGLQQFPRIKIGENAHTIIRKGRSIP